MINIQLFGSQRPFLLPRLVDSSVVGEDRDGPDQDSVAHLYPGEAIPPGDVRGLLRPPENIHRYKHYSRGTVVMLEYFQI